jgi:hypothetical protein
MLEGCPDSNKIIFTEISSCDINLVDIHVLIYLIFNLENPTNLFIELDHLKKYFDETWYLIVTNWYFEYVRILGPVNAINSKYDIG